MTKNKDKKVVFWVLGIILAVVILLAVLAYKSGFIADLKNFNINDMIEYINSFGKLAGFMFILIFSLRTLFIFFPYAVMVILGGSIFGSAYGFLYSMISVFTCGTLAFAISRYVGKEFIERLFGEKIKIIEDKIEDHGGKIIFIMRISLVFPFDLLSYAAGLTKLKYRHFILGTVFGVLPETFTLTFLGENIKHPFSNNFILAIALVVLTVIVPLIFKKKKIKVTNMKNLSEEE